MVYGCGGGSAPPVKTLTSIAIRPQNPSVAVGATAQFSAQGTFSDGTTADVTSQVTWTSADSTVASISGDGEAKGLAVGRPTITATSRSLSSSTRLIIVSQQANLVPRFGYVANMQDGTLSAFVVDTVSGRLRHQGYQLTGQSPSGVWVEPRGEYVYVANSNSNTISAFRSDTAGNLSVVPGAPFADPGNPLAIVVDPSGSFAYTANSGGQSIGAYAIDAATGALTAISGSPFGSGLGPTALTIDPTGRFLYCASSNPDGVLGFAIDPASGALSALSGSPFSAGTNPFGVALNATGSTLYVANSGSANVSVFSVDPASGALTIVAGSPFATGGGTEISGITVSPDGRTIYVANFGSSNVSALKVESGGTLSPVAGSPFVVDSSPRGVLIDPTGKFMYVPALSACEVEIFAIAADGSLSAVNRIRTRQQAAAIAFSYGGAAVTTTPKFAYATNLGSNTVSAFAVSGADGSLTPAGAGSFPTGAQPFGVASDPRGRFVYVSNGQNPLTGTYEQSISGFTVNVDGTLAGMTGSPFPAGRGTTGLTVESSGRFLYAANFYDQSLSAYTLDPSTGALTEIAGSPFPTGIEPVSVVADPGGRFLYVANQNGNCNNPVTANCSITEFRINPNDGSLTEIGRATQGGVEPSGLAADATGQFLYLANQTLGVLSAYSINAIDGTLTYLNSTTPPPSSAAVSVIVDPTSAFAVADIEVIGGGVSVNSFAIESPTGMLATNPAVSVPGGPTLFYMTMDPSGQYVYAADQGTSPTFQDGKVWAYKLDKSTGALTLVNGAPFLAGHSTISVAVTGQTQ
jgi:6-phosphogluconolactonase (cycloisomerase 2 family)